MAGPNIQMPTVYAQMVSQGIVMPEWAAFLGGLAAVAFNGTRSSTSAFRPTSLQQGRWIGMPYFDTTLGKPIWLSSVDPDVWVDATGAVV